MGEISNQNNILSDSYKAEMIRISFSIMVAVISSVYLTDEFICVYSSNCIISQRELMVTLEVVCNSFVTAGSV